MSSISASKDASIDVIAPDSARERIIVSELPFLIGRGATGNHLNLPDPRISRQCAALVETDGEFWLEDRGQRQGLFVNGKKVERKSIEDRDVISFGLEDSYTLVFRIVDRIAPSLQTLMTRMESVAESYATSGGLSKLKLLLEATALLHSQLPLDAVLEAMLDRAIEVTGADRGLLLEADDSGRLRERIARKSESVALASNSLSPSQTAIGMAMRQESSVITEDLHLAHGVLNAAESIIAQRLRAVVAIPLYAMSRANTQASLLHIQRGKLLGMLYLDSQRVAAFSAIDRQILDAIAAESASILDNARLVEHERERQRIERELGIARNIQQALLPRDLDCSPHLDICGLNTPCAEVGGDYFDVFPIDSDRTAFLIADVSGKGLGAALLTPMLQGALSAMSMNISPERAFAHVNAFLCKHAEVGRYATVFFGILDRDGNLEYLSAGHPSPLLLRQDGVTDLHTEGSFPLGLIPEARHSVVRTKMQPGDALALFSDGITEAADIAGDFFGTSRLKEVLETQVSCSLDEIKRSVVGAVEQFSSGTEQADDLTLLLVRYTGSSSSQSTCASTTSGGEA